MSGLKSHHADLIYDRGLDPELLTKYGVESSDRLGDCIAIPYVKGGEVVNHKYRTLGGEKKFAQDGKSVKCFWNYDVITDETLKDEPLIICEGEMDAFALIQSGFVRTISVPDGAPETAKGASDDGSVKYSYLTDEGVRKDLMSVKRIILATDDDVPGQALLQDLAVRLGKGRCQWIKYPKDRNGARLKDMNLVLQVWRESGVRKTIETASWVEVHGVYRMSELPPVPDQRAWDVGNSIIDTHIKIRLGDFSVWTGIPSMGKTTFVNDIVCRLAMKHNWTICIASFEQKPQIDMRRNLRTWYCQCPVREQPEEKTNEADAWIDKAFSIVCAEDLDVDPTLDWVLEMVKTSVCRHNAKMVVVDPWNEIDHDRPSNMSLTEYTGFAIKQFKKLAARFNIHVAVVAHPTKQQKNDKGKFDIPTLYSISDSSHWANKADLGVVIHREENVSIIRVAKARYHGINGLPGDIPCLFSKHDGRYTVREDLYQPPTF